MNIGEPIRRVTIVPVKEPVTPTQEPAPEPVPEPAAPELEPVE